MHGFFFNSHKPSLFYMLGFIILCGRDCSYFNCFFAVQGKKLLDIDFPEGPFGTKVSALHFATSTMLFLFSILFLIGEVILYAFFFILLFLLFICVNGTWL